MKKKQHILYIDDDQDIVFAQQRILAHYGYAVSAFTHPMEAIEYFRSDPESFDIAIVDLVMPVMKGDQLAAELKSLKPNLPVVLCTGFGTDIAETQVKALGIEGFLLKPIASKLMLEMISHLVDDDMKK